MQKWLDDNKLFTITTELYFFGSQSQVVADYKSRLIAYLKFKLHLSNSEMSTLTLAVNKLMNLRQRVNCY